MSCSSDYLPQQHRHQLAPVPQPWSKQHKRVTKAGSGGLKYPYMSNSFVQPLHMAELLDWCRDDQDHLVQAYLQHDLSYTANGGSRDVRQAIADTIYGPDITADHILVTPGAQVALQLVARAVCHADMHAITFSPGYQSVVQGPSLAGAGSVTQIPLHPSNQWQLDETAIAETVRPAIQPNTSYVVINQPYNPAGTLLKPAAFHQLVALAQEQNMYLLCDEVYRLLEHDANDRLPTMADAYDKGISVVTLSKPWGACGTTLGWIACRDKPLLDAIRDHQYFGTACVSRATEVQARMILGNSHRILERALATVRYNKGLLQQFVSQYKEWFTWVPPTAGAIAAIRFLGPLSSQELGQVLAEQAGIGIKPAYCFQDCCGPMDPELDYFRVGFGEVRMPEALLALEQFVQDHQLEWRAAMLPLPR